MPGETRGRLSTIRDRELIRCHAAAAELFSPGLSADNYVDRAFRFVSRLVANDLSAYGILDPASKAVSASFDSQPPGLQSAFEAFGSLMHKYAPFRFDPAVNGGEPYSVPDFYTRRQFHDLDIYQEVHAPMGFSDHGFVLVPSPDAAPVFIGLFRAGGDFRRAEKELLRLAQPHLANARQLALALTAVQHLPLEPEVFARLGFTARESEVISWLTYAKTNAEIGQLMRVRIDTVSRYLHAIYEKMGVENRTAAALHALELARKADLQIRQANSGAIFLTARVESADRQV
jgi:DNA-binding CsgD family transcriptional regulator